MGADQNWEQVEDLFACALERAEAEREDFVRQSDVQDGVRQQVLAMLGARGRMGEFLEDSALEFRGQIFGKYRAFEEIGRGGMSVVYRGQRVDGDYEKRVAIKVVLAHTGPAREVQILAGLEHPNVAQLLDAGATSLGFRYLVMEYVDGVPCTEFKKAVAEREKLKLFLEVCAGVQAAHQALIVHRDLKPANILVTRDGVVKLLDFGIAKLLEPSGEQTAGVRAYTLDYASPEQILGHGASTADDVYALGAVLCEWLSGRTPRDLKDLPIDEVVKRIRDTAPDVRIEGDLGQIVKKAIAADAGHRYSSAAALAADVERYLRNEPVEARAPRWSYLAAKFARRHSWSVAAVAVAAVALMATTGFALRQQRLAEKRFDQVRGLARAVLFDLHDEVSKLQGSLEARKLIADRSVQYLAALAADESASADVQRDVAASYLRLSNIEGKDLGGASLGRSKEALEHAGKALEIARKLTAAYPKDLKARLILVDGLDYTTTAYVVRGEPDKGAAFGEEAVREAEKLVAAAPGNAEYQERLALVTKQLASAYAGAPKAAQAIALFRKSLEMRELLWKADPASDAKLQRLAEAHNWLSVALWRRKDYEQSEVHSRLALQRAEELFLRKGGAVEAVVASAALQMATVDMRAKRYETAIGYIGRAIELRSKRLAAEPQNVMAALRLTAAYDRMGNAYRVWGKLSEAAAAGERALGMARKVRAKDPDLAQANRELVFALVDLAITQDKAGKHPRACALSSETLALMGEGLKGVRPEVDQSVKTAEQISNQCRKQ